MAPKSKPVMVHIRLEKELHQNLQRAVAENGTTLQIEITRRLDQSFNLKASDHVKNLIQQTVATTLLEGGWMVVGGETEASNERKKARPASAGTKTADESAVQTPRKAP